MSGLVKMVKKQFKKSRERLKKVLKSKVFKVIAIAVAVVFTGGAALGVLGAVGTGAGFMGTLAAGFSGGMSALGAVGGAIWSGVKAAGSSIKGFMTGGSQAAGSTGAQAFGINGTAQGASTFGQSIGAEAAASTGAGVTGAVTSAMQNPLVQSTMVSAAGNMATGYAQGEAQEDQMEMMEKQRMSRDQYGYDGYGKKTGELVDPRAVLSSVTANQDQATRVGLDTPPATVNAPSVAAPSERVSKLRERFIASLDNFRPAAGAV